MDNKKGYKPWKNYGEKSHQGHASNSPDDSDGSSESQRESLQEKKSHPDGTETEYQIGDRVKVDSDHKDNYEDFADKVLIVTHVAVSHKDHPGYDDGVAGQALYDFKTLDGKEIHSSLYDYELVGA
jgi:hypothetical protein